MEKPFNNLSPAQAERLDLVTEEMGEVLHAIGKIKRHGYNSFNPNDILSNSNKQNLEEKLGHLLYAINLLSLYGEVWQSRIDDYQYCRENTIKQWMHHQ